MKAFAKQRPRASAPLPTSRAHATDRPFPRRQDPHFSWAADDARLDAWRGALTEWVNQRASRTGAVKAGNALLDFVKQRPEVRPTPEAVCRRDAPLAASFSAWVQGMPTDRATVLNHVHEFFGWYLDTHLSAPDDYGFRVCSPAHINPVARRHNGPAPVETARDPLPTRYLRELRRILMDKNWEWAKKQPSDWLDCTDAHTGEQVRTWCPVRASALALKLLLPLRTFQIRMLDSGEGDTLVHSPKGWSPNTGVHAPSGKRTVRQGFLRRFADPLSGTEITGFFVNTNKTADAHADEAHHGYELPWEHRDAIGIADDLAAWQARYNAVEGPLAWSDVADAEVRLSGTQRSGATYFLMRSPRPSKRHPTDPRQPIGKKTLERLWVALLAELESRMAVRGETRPDGSRIRFVRPGKKKGKYVPLFDLHTLRVSLLTALATEGKVPLHVLSKVVAGHASLVMTLRYVRTNPTDVTRCLSDASERVDATEQANFMEYLASEQRKEEAIVSNDAAGMMALGRANAGLWIPVSTGVCPVGGTRCGDGGPKLSGKRHAPVPGGSANCTACRFHITGPAFLPALRARFNAASLSMEGFRRELHAAEAALTAAEDRRFARQEARQPFDRHEVPRAQSRVEAAEARVATAVITMQSCFELVERCAAVARTHQGGLNVVLAGSVSDVEVAVRETTQFEVWDAVCQSARLHPCPEVSEATLRRSQAIDRLLMRRGAPPVFTMLPEDLALAAGNELTRWVSSQMGRDVRLNLLDGSPVESTDVAQLVADLVERLVRDGVASPQLAWEDEA